MAGPDARARPAPLRLGVFVDQRIEAGGGFQQSLTASVLASKLAPELCRCTYFSPYAQTVEALAALGLDAHRVALGPLRLALLAARSRIVHPGSVRLLRRLFGANALERVFESRGIELVYFTSPTPYAQRLERLNYFYTVWDLCHRDELEFPEVRHDREFESRERLYRAVLPKAARVFVDSEQGARQLARRYAVDAERIRVLAFSPSRDTQVSEPAYEAHFVDVRQTYGIDGDYVFYPAQFWAHKNHVYLLEALHALEARHGIRLSAVFSGGDIGGAQAFVAERARALGLADRVKFIGFVPGRLLPYLYRQSLALVMPTYFGPTNIPPLEALMHGTPVVYPQGLAQASGLEAGALTIDLADPDTLVERLRGLASADSAADAPAQGRALLHRLDDEAVRLATLSDAVAAFLRKRLCWPRPA